MLAMLGLYSCYRWHCVDFTFSTFFIMHAFRQPCSIIFGHWIITWHGMFVFYVSFPAKNVFRFFLFINSLYSRQQSHKSFYPSAIKKKTTTTWNLIFVLFEKCQETIRVWESYQRQDWVKTSKHTQLWVIFMKSLLSKRSSIFVFFLVILHDHC